MQPKSDTQHAMQLVDGKWACPDAGGAYPSFAHQLLHPCSSNCCGGATRAPVVMQLVCNFYAPVRATVTSKYVLQPAWHAAGANGNCIEDTNNM